MENIDKEHESHRMGMHTEQLSGRTQQVYFSAEESENFSYPEAFDVDFNKRTEFDAADLESHPEVDPEEASRIRDRLLLWLKTLAHQGEGSDG